MTASQGRTGDNNAMKLLADFAPVAAECRPRVNAPVEEPFAIANTSPARLYRRRWGLPRRRTPTSVPRSEGRRRSMSGETEPGPLGRSGEADVRRPIAIAILSYDRPHYLTQVLDSLAPQLSEFDQVCLFQDGAWNPHSGITKTDPEFIEECCMRFSAIIPQGMKRPMRFFSKTISYCRSII